MQIISSYGVELRKQNIPIRQTLEIYRSAVSYLIGIYVQVWEEIAEIPDAKRRFNAAEHLVHTTKKNHACFDFDIRFPKMPSYLRRSAIQHALGTVSSFPISSPASPDTRTRSHLHGFLPHILQSHLQSFCQVLCSDVSYMPIFPVSAQSHVLSGICGSVPVCGTSGLFHWDDL